MLKKALIFATLFLTLGCSSQKSADLLADATVALDGASSAKDCAAETYALARKALEEAQELQARGEVEQAKAKARVATTLAKQAREEAQLNAEDCQRRKDAANAVEQKLNVVDELSGGTQLVLDDTFKVIYFDFDESFLSSAAVADLQSNVAVLKSHPQMRVVLAAHTDDRGTTEYNLALSQKRGEAVKDQAVNMGVESSRMIVVPYGKEKPAAFGSREQDHALNRRVEFIPR